MECHNKQLTGQQTSAMTTPNDNNGQQNWLCFMWNEQIVVTCGVLHANEVKYMLYGFGKESNFV